MLSPRSCRTRSPGLSSSLPLASIPFFQGGFHTDTRSQGKPLPTDIRLCGIRLGVSVCGNDDKVNLFCHYFRNPKTSDFFGQKYGCFASKVRMFASKKSDVFEFPFLWDVSAFFLLPPQKKSFVKNPTFPTPFGEMTSKQRCFRM